MPTFFLFFIYLSWGLQCEPGLNNVRVTLKEVNGAELYDVQLKPTYRQYFYISVTHELAESFQIPDLIPETNYDIRVRTKNATDWSDFHEFTSCKTNSPSDDQVCNITAIENGKDYIALKWDAPANKPDSYSVTLSWPPHVLYDTKISQPYIKIGSLPFGTSINVSITAQYSDRVGKKSEHYITKTLGSQKFMNVYRISEECTYCEVDFLYNHDSGNLAADMSFVTYANHNFEPQFPTSVTTQYCVEYFDQPWALYVSCNGNKTTEYTCVCNNYIDRQIGRLNTTSCHESHHNEACDDCTAENMTYSNSMVGRMPVYFPWPHFDHHTHAPVVPPKNESIEVGHWFSTPSASQCSELDTVGKNGCFWKRHSRQVFVNGQEFIDAGLKYKNVNNTDYGTLKENIQIAQKLFVERSDRCCGC